MIKSTVIATIWTFIKEMKGMFTFHEISRLKATIGLLEVLVL